MYFDLEYTVRTEGVFRHKLKKLASEFQYLSDKAETKASVYEEAQNKLQELLRHCKYNPSFLMGYYYPMYPKSDPMTLQNFPFAFHLMSLNIGGYMVIRGSRQIAKSTTLAARQRLYSHILPKFSSLYIAPKSEQVKTYANKLKELENAFRFPVQGYKYRQNLYLKEYPNGSRIELFNVDTQVSNIRGKSADELLFDEYQNFDPTFEPEVSEIQSASTTPVTIYAGTSLTTDTALEEKYASSSQGVWVIQCPACNHDNIPTPEHGVMDMIQFKGVCCSKCGGHLDVTTGRFIHLDQHRFKLGRIGFHIPQIIVPAVVNNRIRWEEIYRKKNEQDPRKFFQENLGIPTQEGEREITEGDLKRICILGQETSPFMEKATSHRYMGVFSGCDWGGSDYDTSNKTKLSYTVHVIMGLNHDYSLEIIHAKRYEGMSYHVIADDIIHNHNAYNGMALGADHGVGYAYNMLLREKMPPENNLIFKYAGPTSEVIRESPTMFNMYSLNRTESITALYYAIRQMRIRTFDWDARMNGDTIGAYLSDFLNLIRVPSETASGATGFLYRKHGAKSDDFLHAVNFAYVVARVYLQENIVEDKSLLQRMKGAITYGHSDIENSFSNMPEAFSM
jgi:hypothetical protein